MSDVVIVDQGQPDDQREREGKPKMGARARTNTMGLLTTEEAAERIGLSTRSIRALVAAGKLKACYLGPKGGMVRFTQQALDEYRDASAAYGSRDSRRPASSRRPARRSAP